jgi:carbon-monoxide dehydrogenase medium subunit
VAVLSSIESSRFKNIRIALGAVAPTPIRAIKAEGILEGAETDGNGIIDAAKKASDESSPIDDHRASAEYRRLMVEVLVKRAIVEVITN